MIGAVTDSLQVPAHAREEYLRFLDFLEAAEADGLSDEEQKLAYEQLQDAAVELSQVVQVTRAQVSDMAPVSVMLAMEAQNREVIDKLSDIAGHMGRMNKLLGDLVKTLAAAPARETRSKSRKAAAGAAGAAGGDGFGERLGEDSESEIEERDRGDIDMAE